MILRIIFAIFEDFSEGFWNSRFSRLYYNIIIFSLLSFFSFLFFSRRLQPQPTPLHVGPVTSLTYSLSHQSLSQSLSPLFFFFFFSFSFLSFHSFFFSLFLLPHLLQESPADPITGHHLRHLVAGEDPPNSGLALSPPPPTTKPPPPPFPFSTKTPPNPLPTSLWGGRSHPGSGAAGALPAVAGGQGAHLGPCA